jgi:hypothetical protein
MVKSLKELYTRGKTFNEQERYICGFAQGDVMHVSTKSGPLYSLIPDDEYRAGEFTAIKYYFPEELRNTKRRLFFAKHQVVGKD